MAFEFIKMKVSGMSIKKTPKRPIVTGVAMDMEVSL